MIICKECGYHNGDADAFCGSCGSFLEWTGEKEAPDVAPEPEPPPVPEPVAEVSRPGIVTRVRDAVGLHAGVPPSAPTTTAVAPPVTAAPTPVASAPPAPPPLPSASAPPLTSSDPRESALKALRAEVAAPSSPPAAPPRAPVSGDASVEIIGTARPLPSELPSAQKPRAPVVPRNRPAPVHEPPTRRPQLGDVICGECGEGNEATRNYCRRCGGSLEEAVEVHIPWYRRVFRRRRHTFAAGERPSRMRSDASAKRRRGFIAPVLLWGKRILAVAVAVVVVLFVTLPSFRTGVTDWFGGLKRQIIPSYTQVHAVNATSQQQLPGPSALLAIDGDTTTWWSANWSSVSHPVIEFTFSSPVDLGRLIVSSGQPAPAFGAHARPHQLRLTFSDGGTSDVTLADLPTSQTVDVGGHTGPTVDVEIVSIYPGVGGGSDVALREVEFYARQ